MPRQGPKVILNCAGDKIRTKQSFKKECDINNIMRKYTKTGVISPEILNKRQAIFADVSEIGDFQHCKQTVNDAQDAFMTLPAHVRTRFDNDPGKLLDFCADSNNRDEAIELGIITKVEEQTPPQEPPAVPPEPPPEP